MHVLILLAACSWTNGQHTADSTDADFVRQVVPTLLGRKPHGSAEVAALTTIAHLDGRRAVVDALLGSDDFADHWSNVLIDDMQVQLQKTDSRLYEPLPAAVVVENYTSIPAGTTQPIVRRDNEPLYCFAGQSKLNRDSRARLVQHVLSASPDLPALNLSGPSAAPISGWRPRDLLMGALEQDRIFAAWRGYSATFVTAPEQILRGQLYTEIVRSAFFGQDKGCTKCHNGGFSATDAGPDAAPDVDRFANVGIDLSRTLFAPTIPPADAEAVQARALYEDHGCIGCHGGDGRLVPSSSPRPRSCPTNLQYDHGDHDSGYFSLATRVPYLSWEELVSTIRCMDGSLTEPEAQTLGRYLKRWLGDQESLDRVFAHTEGFRPSSGTPADSELARAWRATFLGAKPWGVDTACAPSLTELRAEAPHPTPALGVPFVALAGTPAGAQPNHMLFVDRLTEGYAALPAYLTSDETGTAYARAIFQDTLLRRDEPARGTQPAAGMAGALAMEIVDDVHEEVFGTRLTLSHGLHRNNDQATWHIGLLRAFVRADGTWSLHDLLRTMVLSPQFNRLAPKLDPEPPYDGEPVFNPYSVAEVEVAKQKNGTGDLVHRWSLQNLARSVTASLGWGYGVHGSAYDGQTSRFADPTWMERIGQRVNSVRRGFSTWSSASWAVWDERVGQCRATNIATDWITHVTREATAGPAPKSWLWLFSRIKDQLLAEPVLRSFEYTQLQTLTGAALDGPVSGPNVEAIARQYCGALLTTPDYLVAGINPVRTLPHYVAQARYDATGTPTDRLTAESYLDTWLRLRGGPVPQRYLDDLPPRAPDGTYQGISFDLAVDTTFDLSELLEDEAAFPGLFAAAPASDTGDPEVWLFDTAAPFTHKLEPGPDPVSPSLPAWADDAASALEACPHESEALIVPADTPQVLQRGDLTAQPFGVWRVGWVAPAAGRYRVETTGTTFDARLEAFDAGCQSVAVSDDPGHKHALLDLDLEAGEVLFFKLSATDGHPGPFVLLLSELSCANCSCAADADADQVCDDVDACWGFGPEDADDDGVCDHGWQLLPYATPPAPPTSPVWDCPYDTKAPGFVGPGPDLVARGDTTDEPDATATVAWVAPSHGTWRFETTGSAFDTVLTARDAGCATLASNDDDRGARSQLELTLAAGDELYLDVSAAHGAAGPWVLLATELRCDDLDLDGFCDGDDLCYGPGRYDGDGDLYCDDIDACDGPGPTDSDGDHLCDLVDGCVGDGPWDTNKDGVCDKLEACLLVGDLDSDLDGHCDAVDACWGGGAADADGDLLCDDVDHCQGVGAWDGDADGYCDGEDACHGPGAMDSDDDGVCDLADACFGVGSQQTPTGCAWGAHLLPPDGVVDPGDTGLDTASADPDQDGAPAGTDNCPQLPNPDQADWNGDGEGDACQALQLAVAGTCPGKLDIDVTGLTPGGAVAVLLAAGPGDRKPPANHPCAAFPSGLSGEKFQVYLRGSADAAGTFTFGPTVQARACGRWVQLIDEATCMYTAPFRF